MQLIEKNINEIIASLENEVMALVTDESIDKQMTNIHMTHEAAGIDQEDPYQCA